MLENVLPNNIDNAIKNVDLSRVNEIRLRAQKPIILFIGGYACYLCELGICYEKSKAIIATKQNIEDIVFRASECSIYSVNEQIKRGFITCENGVRIGLGGEIVAENGVIKTIKNFSSLCIRLPHKIVGCSLGAINEILTANGVNNTLVISPPGAGKTTFLRDVILQIDRKNYCFNILVADERGEIAGEAYLGKTLLDSDTCDVLSFVEKPIAIKEGLRVLTPNLIVTDELAGEEDSEAVITAINSGVSVIASVHGQSIDSVKQKKGFARLFDNKCFDRFVVLSLCDGNYKVAGIYNKNFERIRAFV